MGIFVDNRPISCIYCGYGPNQGKESTFKDRRGIIHECRWTCGKCGMLIRCDEQVKKEEPKKEEGAKDETK